MLTGRSFNSTSKIDSFARILFPLTFTLFNVIYWMHYFKVLIIKDEVKSYISVLYPGGKDVHLGEPRCFWKH